MFGIKLFKTYNKIKHILVKPTLKMWCGLLLNAPFLISKRQPEIRLFKSQQWYINGYEFRPEFQEKLNKWGLGWVKPIYELPSWLKFGIYNYDFAGKWKYDSARFEWRGVFAIVFFGFTIAFYLEVPKSDDGMDRCEDFYYEFMMEYLNGENAGDLIACIMDAGIVNSHSKEHGDVTYNTLAKSWFKPEWHKAYDTAYQRYEIKHKNGFEKPEWILCAATKRNEPRKVESNPYHSGTNDILNVELGYRHHDIFRRFNVENEVIDTGMYAQGFFTSRGRWVSRKEAAEIAYAAGQIDEPIRMLTSEDLY